MKRFVDVSGEPYAMWSILRSGNSVMVRCTCGSEAWIRSDNDQLVLICKSCMQKKVYEQAAVYRVSGNCNYCDRWFNEQLQEQRQFTQHMLNYPCPHCGTVQAMPVQKRFDCIYYAPEIRQGREPYFGMELYFMAAYRGKPVWALNREHLDYLLHYIAADQRQRPTYAYTRTASYRVPRYMKAAKNRDGIVKLLTRMQNQW
ncbi:hypothetical protein [Paenibacillus campi]|uniref:hypothetical protein n=1 Tax=Paenibacillus campi TaxID=3106031 RepID=UPI002AFEC129|nr:hypothetical protein [Paenibacillus sp. SGZ-1014]